MSATIGTDVGYAVEVIRSGGLVAIPTETVYGLGADASNESAVRRIFVAKGRPVDHPVIVHLADGAQLSSWSRHPSAAALLLAETCWPGPLTIIVPRADTVLDVVTGGRDTVGLRVPAHPLTAELLARFGGGIAAPSANRFGRISPTNAAHVADDLGAAVDYILDGGQAAIGVESTIVDCTGDVPQILRHGGVTDDELATMLDGPLERSPSGPSRAPGMLASHYAPRAPVELYESGDEAFWRAKELQDVGIGVAVIDYGSNLGAYARQLYSDLRAADGSGAGTIIAVLPPAAGLGHAIRDRLTKAAAPRPPT